MNLCDSFTDVELFLSIISMIDLWIQIQNKKCVTKNNFTPTIVESDSDKELIETWIESTTVKAFVVTTPKWQKIP